MLHQVTWGTVRPGSRSNSRIPARSSLRPSSSLPWPRPPLRAPSTTCPSSSSSPTPPTTWPSLGEPPSKRPSLLELWRDSEVWEVTAMPPMPELRRRETGGLMEEMMMVRMLAATLPPPPQLPLPRPPPPLLHPHLPQPPRPMLHQPQLLQPTPPP